MWPPRRESRFERGATVLRLMPNQDLHGPDTHVIELRDCYNITLRDLSVHGAYLTMNAVNEQMHGLNVNAGCENVIVERVLVFQSAGDGIRFLGDATSPTGKVRRIWVEDCSFVQNKRTGVAFQLFLSDGSVGSPERWDHQTAL